MCNETIIIKVQGGLGNQLFQYALYEWLKVEGKNVYLDINSYLLRNRGLADCFHNGYELEKVFRINAEYASRKLILKVYGPYWNYFYKIIEKVKGKKGSVVMDIGFDYSNTDSLLRLKEAYLDGYWNSFIIADKIRDDLLNKLLFDTDSFSPNNRELLSFVRDNYSVSIHVRHGDYLKLSNVYPILEMDYYNKAIQFFKSKNENAKFIVFSDDIPWCKKNFIGSEFFLVDWNTGSDSFIDMCLMSECHHNIIANSTFSFWAAWLNQNYGKIVIRPQKYYNNSMNTEELFPKEWIVL